MYIHRAAVELGALLFLFKGSLSKKQQKCNVDSCGEQQNAQMLQSQEKKSVGFLQQ